MGDLVIRKRTWELLYPLGFRDKPLEPCKLFFARLRVVSGSRLRKDGRKPVSRRQLLNPKLTGG